MVQHAQGTLTPILLGWSLIDRHFKNAIHVEFLNTERVREGDSACIYVDCTNTTFITVPGRLFHGH